jgi:hypothetical protein
MTPPTTTATEAPDALDDRDAWRIHMSVWFCRWGPNLQLKLYVKRGDAACDWILKDILSGG